MKNNKVIYILTVSKGMTVVLCRAEEKLTARVEIAGVAADMHGLSTDSRHALLVFQRKVQLLERQRVLLAYPTPPSPSPPFSGREIS
jgi:hypothetical protein